eukprot:1462108-Prorocentrum_lima.AAC.1
MLSMINWNRLPSSGRPVVQPLSVEISTRGCRASWRAKPLTSDHTYLNRTPPSSTHWRQAPRITGRDL